MRLFREVAIETPCIGVYQGTPCRCSDRGYYKTRQERGRVKDLGTLSANKLEFIWSRST